MIVSDHWIRFFRGFVVFVRLARRPASDIEADRAHEFESVALLDDALPEGIIEMHRAPFEVVFESTGRSRLLQAVAKAYHGLARFWPELFAYQFILEAEITTLDEEATTLR